MELNRKICKCMHVYEDQIIEAIRSEGSFNLDIIRECTFAGKGCGTCLEDVNRIIKEYQEQNKSYSNYL